MFPAPPPHPTLLLADDANFAAAPIDERLDAVVTATDSDAGGQEGEPGAEGGVVRDEPVDEGEAAATVVAIHESGTKDEDEASNDNGEPGRV